MSCKRMTAAACLPFLLACATPALGDNIRATANFTGPLLTPNAANLPRGLTNIEPYLVYQSSTGTYDGQGRKQDKISDSHQWQLLVPVIYGVTDRLQAQLSLGMTHAYAGGTHTDGARLTDTSAKLQYMLLAPNTDGTRPAISVAFAHRFPTGAYDRLDANPLNGTGNGASINTLALSTQHYLWLPDGRPLRWRSNLSYSLPPSSVGITGKSVYGTPADFRGHVRLGRSLGISLSAEYSIDEHWVLALDLAYDHESSAHLHGMQGQSPVMAQVVDRRDPARSVYSVAPAVEYNVNRNLGVIAGTQFSVAGRHNDAFVAPQVAVNMVF
ncbi:hypothetical protein [Dyella subtropica]|uniref:hypothetical protein n=1 Tax=Dyella subtropica TaxID=2992127 RepID=UPI00224D3D14|nr:hypothetical protein [Dyella subtropica]